MRNKLVSVLVCLTFALTLSHCSRKSDSAIENSAQKSTASSKKSSKNEPRYLNFINRDEPEYLDPGLMSGTVESNIAIALFEGLTSLDPKTAESTPGVATEWKVSDDGKTYTFTLRKDAKWSNGRSVTAHDFVYSWERVLNPTTASKYAYILYYIKNAKPYNIGETKDASTLGMKALDDHTLQVELENPAPFFPYLLAHSTYYPVPKEAVEKFGNRWTRSENIVSNGPFMLKSWVPYEAILVVKNPQYWNADKNKLAGVRYIPVPDRETGLKMYQSGEADILWDVPSTKIELLSKEPDFLKHTYLASYFYRLNVTKPPLDNVKVRQALAVAIDRDKLVNQFLKKAHYPITHLTALGIDGYDYPEGPSFDPEKAKQLLAEAGYKDPNTFPEMSILYNTDEQHKIVAQIIQQMWKDNLGIKVNLINEEWKSYLKTQALMKYQVSRSGWVADYPDPNNFLDLFASYSTLSHTGWKNKEFDDLLAKANESADNEVRYKYLNQAESVLLKELPIIPLYSYGKQMMVKPYVKGFYGNPADRHTYQFVEIEEGK